MKNLESDAFVFFGATGDLAYEQIFPALQAMIIHGHFEMPTIGVAKAAWSLDQLRARARESLEKHGGVDSRAFAALSAKLRYVSGDYGSPETFRQLQNALGSASRPLFYLAVPADLFATVAEGLAVTSTIRIPGAQLRLTALLRAMAAGTIPRRSQRKPWKRQNEVR
jgi:glucose-6-phosphate 1-dehydrogenase